MIKNLTKHGNSMALIIDRPILDLLNISEGTPLEISTNGESLTISPVKDEKRLKQFQKALEKTNKKYGRALKNMA
ncbi:MAG: AbrB/MazE/SpoVT family DNA-binding domain-containing protein [Halobacteriovoraceae bacterium]|nr:AbrB/MazE/SpoVT family DNA-binding domain-containing protein [Halobacteriovoraceae bacterium]